MGQLGRCVPHRLTTVLTPTMTTWGAVLPVTAPDQIAVTAEATPGQCSATTLSWPVVERRQRPQRRPVVLALGGVDDPLPVR
jgi:hypothetical protein